MLSVVTGDPAEIADELLMSPDVDLVTFTGGVAIGKYIAAKAVYKRQVLELAATIRSSCSRMRIWKRRPRSRPAAPTRTPPALYGRQAHPGPASRRGSLRAAAGREDAAIKYGDPLDPALDMGTVIDERSAIRFESVVNEAIAQGARLLIGNVRRGALYSPTVIDQVTPQMTVVREETSGRSHR